MRVYLLAMLISATVAYLMTPLARWCALRWGAITAVRDRDVHAIPTPRLGGMAIFAGMLVAIVMASRLPFLEGVYANPRPLVGIMGGAAIVCALGVADDIWDLDWLTKLMGQVLAGGFLAWQGVLLYQLPTAGMPTLGSTRMATFLTVFTVVVAMNAVNFVDGLDGLAAGVLAIGGTAFFLYAYLLTEGANPGAYANANLAALVLVVLVGACVGFLPHNVYPARIFMGDSGAMVLGFVFSAAAIIITGQIDPEQVLARQRFPAFLPMLLPFAVLLLPLLDMGLAIIRRVGAGKSPFHPDRMHLHHRLLQLGHSHRRAVAMMYVWTAVFAFGAGALVVLSTTTTLIVLGIGVVVATLLTLGPLRGKTAPAPSEAHS
ncbi:glycosyltransferase family 4 protein [Cellulomonas fengjieae]|uniref:Undecaprenyl/decaprenyl-phosphate alpha-N-acetylglucosaminyl 1-phosphate transferase n=1 Tax=Cellulomonas fengjieae TaxID=2819978 RepID=A0ABS3SKW1_9CELL|nr:MraY family glycosyltransferase [Cellulomonas fengjieae]MBO3086368.1 undecaprenyl/decaprenyl-phosphate alpha-N-acetylglucosaminyl 1-phosphate transferase [Cellulomonas fengjieae]MBO3100365.1 undecaprenyl/decaprenyl-phosphate alpha-N-acetylglucosaminyl 1-phosphate transferase [Cellulomonas fengjieae]QVI66759.1 undecaprenyl/decaprenyl-phosphate alpha-N-acetylglucosaminyl 1-phosphate transferase [Cellulomonas fengjieae]